MIARGVEEMAEIHILKSSMNKWSDQEVSRWQLQERWDSLTWTAKMAEGFKEGEVTQKHKENRDTNLTAESQGLSVLMTKLFSFT